MNINLENYEEYFVRLIDDELSSQEQLEVTLFLHQHPELKAELDAFRDTVLKSDTSLTFSGKDSLRKGISISNYEEYFMRMVEGDLSSEEKAEVTYFLQQHPQLQAVMDTYKATLLKADEKITFPAKESLRRAITIENCEEYFMRMLEGDLSQAEINEVSTFLQQHPQLQPVMAAYQETILTADEKIIFPDKESLKHHRRRIVPINVQYILTAAVAAALMLFFMMKGINWNEQKITPPVAEIKNEATNPNNNSAQNNSSAQNKSNAIAPENNSSVQDNLKSNQGVVPASSENSKEQPVTAFADNHSSKKSSSSKHKKENQFIPVDENETTAPALFASNMEKLEVAQPKALPFHSRMNRAPRLVLVNEKAPDQNQNYVVNSTPSGLLSVASIVGAELLRLSGRGDLLKSDSEIQPKAKEPVALSIKSDKFSFYHKFFKKRDKTQSSTKKN